MIHYLKLMYNVYKNIKQTFKPFQNLNIQHNLKADLKYWKFYVVCLFK